ncbi:AbiU2 domain-containing protein [Mesorhizobium sp. 113-3-3]|uniref:AbiU2 domain-containing protein n=1 Tax=Mesorhizobium sp. 113-3-3 TaxID=2744516 RepID=UPI001925ABEB|nr:hypothetical protein [Mesorhizobium sp. 113-3-3]BCG76760.1 hypothetical protein MesoLj113b_03020 [Mesorhizobium sp. 113-3-3]
MSKEQTAAEARAQYETAMGSELGAIYAELVQELCRTQLVWNQYKVLFGTKGSRVDLLNAASGSFFRIVQDCLFDQVLLSISRMTDKPSIWGKETLTVKRLAALMPDPAGANRVSDKVNVAIHAEDFCRDWRNNRISHNSLEHRLDPSKTLKEATRLKVDAALAALAGVLNAVSTHYNVGEMAYDAILPSHPDAEGLLYVIYDGLKAEEQRRMKIKTGDYSTADYPPAL